MAVEIEKTESCQAPVAAAFAYVADYRNVPHWLFGVQTFEPVGEKDYGLGSIFDVGVHLGVNIESRLEVDEFVENSLISFDTLKGFKVRSRWHFEAAGAEATTIRAEVTYHLPFGPAGKVMGRIIEPAVKQAVTRSADALKARIEEQARA